MRTAVGSFGFGGKDLAPRLRRFGLIKGSANFNNYRYGYWILCAASRTMNTNFAPEEQRAPHLQENPNVITE
jgi:hypothetical protein